MNSKIAIKFNYQIPGFQEIKEEYIKSESIYQRGQRLIENEMCTLVSESGNQFNFLVEDRFDDFTVTINQAKKELLFVCNCGSILQCCPHSAAALIKIREIYDDENEHSIISGPYTRKEMIKRVLKEREDKAAKEDLQIIFGDNIYGFHKIKSASKKTYEITIRDFNTHNGYCSCPDFKTNKLGTCKHLIFATGQIIKKYSVSEIVKEHVYPFVEIYCDPNYDYNITYYFERDIQPETDRLIHKYFNGNQYILSENYSDFLNFFIEAAEHKSILIRPEVNKKIDKYFEHQSIAKLNGNVTPDFSKIKVDLFDYQEESDVINESKKPKTPEPEEIETTLNHGMQFLNGVFQMATGKELIADGQGISVNKETGEVIMKFKLPGY